MRYKERDWTKVFIHCLWKTLTLQFSPAHCMASLTTHDDDDKSIYNYCTCGYLDPWKKK